MNRQLLKLPLYTLAAGVLTRLLIKVISSLALLMRFFYEGAVSVVYAVPSCWPLIFFCCSPINRDLTEVGRTRPERTRSGVVRGMAESSVPVGGWS